MPEVRDAIERATSALDALARSGESVEDEWQYVTDLHAVWRARLVEVAAARGAAALDPAALEAVERASAETRAIDDPHRAIDWLSTFPQLVLLAVGEPL